MPSRSRMVFEHVQSLAGGQFDFWDGKRRELASPDALAAHQEHVRMTFKELIGGLPDERTPLSDRVTGSLERDRYRIEKVVFESLPGFPVTANLYLPKGGRPPYPVVISPCGHTANGKAGEPYQRLYQLLASAGFAVLGYDPLGQGERAQYFDAERGDSAIGRAVPEHEFAGQQSLLVGVNLARYRIWDGIRAVDYLASRGDIDIERLGCAGCSGGGTVTVYLMALEPRIQAAVPVCYVTSRRAWLATGQLADAEQVQDGAISAGIDHVDLLAAFAPKPVLVCAGIRDFFPIEGARWTVAELQRLYGIVDAGDRAQLFEADLEHGYQHPHREATVRWLSRWLLGGEIEIEDIDLPLEAEEVLHAAPGGQTANLRAKTVFSFTAETAEELKQWRPFQDEDDQGQVEALRQVLMFETPSDEFDQIGDRLVIRPEAGIELEAVFTEGMGAGAPVLRIRAGESSTAPSKPEAPAGDRAVMSLELRGTGTSTPAGGQNQAYARTGEQGYLFYQYGMVGRNYLGGRVADVVAGSRVLRTISRASESRVEAEGPACLAAIMAAVLDPQITGLVLRDGPPSYHEVAATEFYRLRSEWLVPGILTTTDVPELLDLLAKRGVELQVIRQAEPAATSEG